MLTPGRVRASGISSHGQTAARLREQIGRCLLLASWAHAGLVTWKTDIRRVFGTGGAVVDEVLVAFETCGLAKKSGRVVRGGDEWQVAPPEDWPHRDGLRKLSSTHGDAGKLAQLCVDRARYGLSYVDEEALIVRDEEPIFAEDGLTLYSYAETGVVYARGLFAHERGGRHLKFAATPPGGVLDVTERVLRLLAKDDRERERLSELRGFLDEQEGE